MADSNKDRISKEALKAVEDFVKKTEQGKKNANAMNEAFGAMATQLFGISNAAFFKEVPKTTSELEAQKKKVSEIKNELDKSFRDIGKSLKNQFKDAISALEAGPALFDTSALGDMAKKYGIDTFSDINDLQKQINEKFENNSDKLYEFKEDRKKYIKKEQEYYKGTEDFYKKILEDNTELFSGLSEQEKIQKLQQIHQTGFNKLVSEGSEIVREMAMYSDGVDDSIKQASLDASSLKDRLAESTKELESNNKKVFSLGEGFKSVAKNFASGIIPNMLKFDQTLSDAGKNFGFVGMKSKEMVPNMASLGQSAARFGVSMGDAVNMMGELGDELKTIDQDYLANSVEHFMAIEKATGISSGEITTIAGEMMRAGKSAEQVESYMEGANKTAKMFGVNTKKILQGVAKNIDKMRQMGFQGGEESLTRMAARAERLNMNMDEMFDVAKRARSIEGAMEMASELQLAGGSFANIDPMSLLAAARKGPEELQKILTQMGGDIGRFNKETGQLEFDAVDADRLQMVADATGQTVDSIQKGLQKTAKTNQKLDLLGLSGSIDEDSKNFLADLTSLDKDGNIKMDPELSKLAQGAGISLDGVDSLGDLNQEQISALMQVKKDDIASLEEQAEQNQSFEESIKAFKDAIMNLFVVFEPFIKILTSMVQTLNGMPSPIKMLVAGLIGFAMVAPKLGNAMEGLQKGFGAMKSIVGNIKGAFGMGKDGVEGVKDIASKKDSIPGLKDSKDQTPSGSKGGLQSLAEGLKAMGDKDVFKGIGAVALAGPALLLMLAGMPTVLLMGVVGAMGKVVEFGFTSLARGISAMGQAKGLIKGAVAMVIVGAALIPFAFALQMMSDVSWKAVGIAMVMMLGAVVTLIAMGALLSSPIGAFLLIGALALVAVGIALMAFGASLLIFAEAGSMMQGMEFGWLGDLGWNLLIASPGLLLGGIALMTASPGLVLGSIGLIALGVAAQGLSGIDWAMFASIGDALLSLVPGLIGFSLAGLMFANPITLLGMLMMIGNLGMLATIITPLAESLNTGADGLDRFASGLEKLQAAANSLDFERLEALKELSIGMATSGAGGGIGDEIQKIADALSALTKSGGGSGGGGTKKIQVDLKLNGRDLQSIIIDDTEIVS